MDTTERIKKLGGMFKTMRVEGDVIYVVVSFPNNWFIVDDLQEKYGVSVETTESGEYWFFGEMDGGFENIFDAIDYNVAQMTEMIERAQLLNEKVKELKELFVNKENKLSMLKTLRFEFDNINMDGVGEKAVIEDFIEERKNDNDRKNKGKK